MNRKIALITGATAGIGYETAVLLAQNNYNLILTGRRSDRLISLKKDLEIQYLCDILILNFDIRKRKETEDSLNSIPQNWRSIDILVNNAGLAAGLGPVNSADFDA